MAGHRKAQGISVNMIILIIIGLVVLAVVSIIFWNVSKKGDETFKSCTNLQGKCMTETQCTQGSGFENKLGSCGETMVCCTGFKTDTSGQNLDPS